MEFRGVLVCRLSLRCWETTRYPIFRSRLTQRVVGRRRRISTGDKGKVFSHPSNKNYTDTRAFRRFLRFHTSRTRSEEKKNVNNDGRLEGSVTPVGPIEDSSRTNGIKLKEEDKKILVIRHYVSRGHSRNGRTPPTLTASSEPMSLRSRKCKQRARFRGIFSSFVRVRPRG